jgi:hypothetical protein
MCYLNRYFHFGLLILFALSTFIFAGCDQDMLSSRQLDSSISLYEGGPTSTQAFGSSIWYPKSNAKLSTSGSVTIKDDSTFGFRSGVTLHVSSEYQLVTKSRDGEVTAVSDSSGPVVSCECKDDLGSSMPIVTSGSLYCSSTNCSDCTMRFEEVGQNGVRFPVEGAPAGYIRTSAATQFITSDDKVRSPAAFSAMLSLRDVERSFSSFLKQTAGPPASIRLRPTRTSAGLEAPEGTKFAAVQLAGRSLFVALPSSDLPEDAISSSRLVCDGALCHPPSSPVEAPVVVKL